jgi:acetolactate synthase-1/2/3 large subunit
MKQRVADFITDRLYQAGGKNAFLITGGMIMHLTDALRQHGRQTYTCCHHEQAAVMAAEAYGRFTGELGVAYVTAGPAALNTLTGVVGALVDTSPCIVVAGQSKVSQAKVTGPRQFALQGFHTLPIFRQVTKYAVMLDDVSRVRYEVEKAIAIAKTPRVGPVWIEVPIDIQGMMFDPDECEGYTAPDEAVRVADCSDDDIRTAAEWIRHSRRPAILAGAGVRLSDAVDALRRTAEQLGIPLLTSRLGMDLIDHRHPLFVGRPGTYGERSANFTIQNCDLLLVIGCRLGLGLVGHDFADFAHHARKIMVDVDEAELSKPAVVPDIPIRADARTFLERLGRELHGYRLSNAPWVSRTQKWKKEYPVNLPEYVNETDGINSYHFVSAMSEKAPGDAVFVLDTGSCFHVFAQAFKVKQGQRHVITGGLSTMGYWPAAVGVAKASGKDVYCVTGDGSLQFNLQELQTMVHNRLPIKTIVLNNAGYLLIRLTQQNFQEGRLIGTDEESGVSCPDLEKIAGAYGVKFFRISALEEMDAVLDDFIAWRGAAICEVMTPKNQLLMPRVASRKREDGTMESMPYDDMFPFLPRDEYLRNCFRNEDDLRDRSAA